MHTWSPFSTSSLSPKPMGRQEGKSCCSAAAELPTRLPGDTTDLSQWQMSSVLSRQRETATSNHSMTLTVNNKNFCQSLSLKFPTQNAGSYKRKNNFLENINISI